jgi:DNA-binding MarR family transcriptional regulator
VPASPTRLTGPEELVLKYIAQYGPTPMAKFRQFAGVIGALKRKGMVISKSKPDNKISLVVHLTDKALKYIEVNRL